MNKYLQLLSLIAAKKDAPLDHAIEVVAMMEHATKRINELNREFSLDYQFDCTLDQLDDNNKSPVMYAAGSGNLPILTWLIEEKKVDFTNALFFAGESGQLEVIRYLLSRGAKIANAKHDDINVLVAASQGNHTQALQRLLDECQGDEFDRILVTALFYAVRNNNLDVVTKLLNKIVNKDEIAKANTTDDKDNLLHFALFDNVDIEIIKSLITAFPQLIDYQNREKQFPIEYPIKAANVAYVYVLTHTIDPQLFKNQLDSALNTCYAHRHKNSLKIYYLLLKWCDYLSQAQIQNILKYIKHNSHRDRNSYLLLILLLPEALLDTISSNKLWYDYENFGIDKPDKFSDYPNVLFKHFENFLLTSNFCPVEQLDILDFALRNESAFNWTNRVKLAQLKSQIKEQYAQNPGKLGLVNSLPLETFYLSLSQENNSTLKIPDITPPAFSKTSALPFLEELLMQGLEKLVPEQFSLLFKKIRALHSESNAFSVKAFDYKFVTDNPWRFNINFIYPSGDTLLSKAIRLNKDKTVEFLLEQNADVNIKLPGTTTPFLIAAELGNTNIISMLLNKGADIKSVNAKKHNSLMIAVIKKKVQSYEIFTKSGISINSIPNEFPLRVAIKLNDLPSVQELVRLGAEIKERTLEALAKNDALEILKWLVDNKSLSITSYSGRSILYFCLTTFKAKKIFNYLWAEHLPLVNFEALDDDRNSLLQVALNGSLLMFEDILKQRKVKLNHLNRHEETVCDKAVGLVYNYLLKNDHAFPNKLSKSKHTSVFEFFQSNKDLREAELYLKYAGDFLSKFKSIFNFVQWVTLLFIYEEHDNRLSYNDLTVQYLIPLRHYIGACISLMLNTLNGQIQLQFASRVKEKMTSGSLANVLNYHEYWGALFGKSNTFKQIDEEVNQFNEDGEVLISNEYSYACM